MTIRIVLETGLKDEKSISNFELRVFGTCKITRGLRPLKALLEFKEGFLFSPVIIVLPEYRSSLYRYGLCKFILGRLDAPKRLFPEEALIVGCIFSILNLSLTQ